MQTISSFLLLSKRDNDRALETAGAVRQSLERRGLDALLIAPDEDLAMKDFCASAPEGGLAVIVFGGDGTLVGASRRLLSYGARAVILGVNFGKVGFLAEVSPDHWESAVEALAEGRMPVVHRLALQWEIFHEGESSAAKHGFAVNDVVLSRGTLARVLSLHVSVDGQPLGQVRADGILVSSPAGTSGYALSTGASLVHPSVEGVTIAPISPFLTRFPSMVLPPDSVVDVAVDRKSHETYLTVDGQDGIVLSHGDTLRTRGLPRALRFAVPDMADYYRRLGRCGFVPPVGAGS